MHTPGEVLHQRYQVVRLLGRGGLSRVYEVTDLSLSRRWALKEFTVQEPGGGEREEVREHFTRELSLLSKLSHPGLPLINDSFSFEGKDYIVLELIEGETLDSLIAARKEPFPEEQALAWSLQVLDILEYLHGQAPPVIYRDLKPQNLMVTPAGNLRFIDFGIARLFNPVKEQDTIFMGTPGFASPEQFRRSQSESRSDIYSLGALMHCLLTLKDPGLRPFDFEPPSLNNPAISKLMEKIVQKALEIKPENRFQNAAEMKKVLTGELSIDDLSTRGFIIITPKEVHFFNLVPGKENAAEIAVRNCRDNEKVSARLTCEHPGLIVDPLSIDAPSATIQVKPDHKKFPRGKKVETSFTLSTASSKISIPVTVHYAPSFFRRIPTVLYGIFGLLIPLVLFSFYAGDIHRLAEDHPIDFTFFLIFYVILVGGPAFLPTIRQKELKPLALAGNIFLILLPFVVVYIDCYKVPSIALDNREYLKGSSPGRIRSLCHRMLLWGPHDVALELLGSESDRSSLPFILWAKNIAHGRKDTSCSSYYDQCSTVLQGITNQNTGHSGSEMLRWYWQNRHKSTLEWWIDGFKREGIVVSLKNSRDSIDQLLTMLGQSRGLPRDWLFRNGFRTLDLFNPDEVSERVNKALVSGNLEIKSGAERYCSYLASQLMRIALMGNTGELKTFMRQRCTITPLYDVTLGKKLNPWQDSGLEAIGYCYHSAMTPLHCAARQGNVEMVRFLVGQGASVNCGDWNGNTPLHLVSSIKVARILISSGAEINRTDSQGHSPLFAAITDADRYTEMMKHYTEADYPQYDDVLQDPASHHYLRLVSRVRDYHELIAFLLSNGADARLKDCLGQTPLLVTSSTETARLLIAHGADVNGQDNKGYAPLHTTSSYEKAELLIAHGANVNARNKEGETPLHTASSYNIARLLVDHGADVNVEDRNKKTPLTNALFTQQSNMEKIQARLLVALLKKKGAHEKVYAFFDALEKGNVKSMKELLKEEPGLVDCTNWTGTAPLSLAIDKKNRGVTKLLLENGAHLLTGEHKFLHIRALETADMAPSIAELLITMGAASKKDLFDALLRNAAIAGNVNMATLLIARGAHVNGRDAQGCTPLHKAAQCGKKALVELLITKGAQINARDHDGETPLHTTAYRDNNEGVAEILIAHGADVNVKDKQGETPLSRSMRNGHFTEAQLLISHGANLTGILINGNPPLHHAAASGQRPLVSLLLSKGTSPDERDSIGWAPLHHAAFKGHTDIVKLLLDHHANPKAHNSCGETPLLCALESGSMEAAALLRAAGAKERASR